MTQKIKIWSNGIPTQSKVVVVDDAGHEESLLVEGLALELHSDPRTPQPQWLTLTPCAGCGVVVEIEVPVDGSVATEIRARLTGDINEKFSSAREAVNASLVALGHYLKRDELGDVVSAVIFAMR